MFNHAPPDYKCPFCLLISGKEDERNKQKDIVYRNEYVLAFVAPKWWLNNAGNVLVVPNKHYENIYDIPDKVLGEVYKAVKKISIAVKKSYGSDGVSNRQHNEPHGGQDVWHFHVHVFARYKGDKLYQNHNKKRWVAPQEKEVFVKKLKRFLSPVS